MHVCDAAGALAPRAPGSPFGRPPGPPAPAGSRRPSWRPAATGGGRGWLGHPRPSPGAPGAGAGPP